MCLSATVSFFSSLSLQNTTDLKLSLSLSVSTPATVSDHRAPPCRCQKLPLHASSPAMVSAEGSSSSTRRSRTAPSPSDVISGHHRPPFPTPPRPEEPPRRPLPKGVNRYTIHHTPKFHCLSSPASALLAAAGVNSFTSAGSFGSGFTSGLLPKAGLPTH